MLREKVTAMLLKKECSEDALVDLLLEGAVTVKEGHLEKKGGEKALKRYRRRYFRLWKREDVCYLTYHETKTSDAERLGWMPLSMCDVKLNEDTEDVFEVRTKIILGEDVKDGRRYVIKAKDGVDRQEWVSSLLRYRNLKRNRKQGRSDVKENEKNNGTNEPRSSLPPPPVPQRPISRATSSSSTSSSRRRRERPAHRRPPSYSPPPLRVGSENNY
mmetsp:Transcript_4674/g.9103  ORF Transcript_4674/g.9103 Transcript_4674/m.9103 type:complete len:216 (-) Transcript_4674:155-802(-)